MKKALLVLLLLAYSSAAFAANAEERCDSDPLHESLVEGRLHWLLKCGHIPQWKFDYYMRSREYPQFERPGENDEAAQCRDVGTFRGSCLPKGCYAPGSRLLFGGEYVAIEDAYARDLETVSTLGSADIARPLHLKEMPIASFVVGDTKEELIVIETEGGSRLKVTKSHPFFDQTGLMVIANNLVAGETQILTLRGLELVTLADREMYEGKVWNIKPASSDYSDNVIVAEDILTGSIRYQNQWAELRERFLQRNGEPLRSSESNPSLKEYCASDPLRAELLEGRLGWLLKCGYISKPKFEFCLAEEEYPIYEGVAPNSPEEPCRVLGGKRGLCLPID